ncbi:hypothetical protein [Nocardia wallacei]|uniref:hypothetical protein n=1 Tax=Nocardia wallacei TaxID=480035 RepID=UPI002458452C|nr:hypothetical protein [Nocardia wallacei]
MISDYWLAVLSGLLIGSAVTAVGMYLLGFRRVHRDGKTLAVPEIDRRPMRQRLHEFRERAASFEITPRVMSGIVALMAAAVLAGLVQNTAFTYSQRRCNAEFQRTISERADIGADDNRARKENDEAVAALVRGFLALSPESPDRREHSRELLERFDRTMIDNAARQAENERKRAANPYPRC